jgi:hypothetical protein
MRGQELLNDYCALRERQVPKPVVWFENMASSSAS